MEIEQRFGNMVRVKRIKLNMSQEQLSFKSGLHRNYICDVERGKRNISLKAIEKIAKGLNCTIKDLFSEEFK